jgi:small neutral amino acid transporter SnatA (MarC family)
MSTVLAMLLVIDPFGLARKWPKRFEVGLAVAAAGAVAVLLADPVLSALDLSAEGFWIAAGILLLIPGFGRLGRGMNHDVAGPAPIAVAMALATRDGTGIALVGVGVAAVVALLLAALPLPRYAQVLQNILGAAMIIIAFDLIRDGVIAV